MFLIDYTSALIWVELAQFSLPDTMLGFRDEHSREKSLMFRPATD